MLDNYICLYMPESMGLCMQQGTQVAWDSRTVHVATLRPALTLKLSLLLSERDTLMRLLEANLVLEYHMRPPSERQTIVALNVISSTCRAALSDMKTSNPYKDSLG